MTKRHFEAIAKTLRASKPVRGDDIARQEAKFTWLTTVNRLAATFQDFNPNFDAERFLAACGAEA